MLDPTKYTPGDRVLILTQRASLNGTEATVLSVRNRGGRPFLPESRSRHAGRVPTGPKRK